MSDDIYEESARQAVQVAKKAVLNETKRDADTAGFQARNISDGLMNNGQSYNTGAASGPSDVQNREYKANQKVIEARRVIEEVGGFDMADLYTLDLDNRDTEARKFAADQLRLLKQHERVQQQYSDSAPLYETNHNAQGQSDGWEVVKKAATLTSGKRIAIYVVEDALTGMTISKKFRIASVAEKIARVMNATGNPNDSRIAMIESTYEQHITLMKELTGARKANNAQRVSVIESKLSEVNARLGLS